MPKTGRHGTGAIITKPGTSNLYIRFYRDGKQIQMAVGSDSRSAAQELLNVQLGESAQGETSNPAELKRLRYDDLKALYLRQPKHAKQADWHGWKFLDDSFGGQPVSKITEEAILRFVEKRKDVTQATIHRNLAVLRSMFTVAKKSRKLSRRDIPFFPELDNSSEGVGQYVEPEDFRRVLDALPKHLHPFFEFMYATGCRLGATEKIRWSMFNKKCDVLTLPSEIIKTKKPLLLVLDGPILAPLAEKLRGMFRLESRPVFDSTNYRTEYNKAIAVAGLGTYDEKHRTRTGPRIHDCRCSAAVNLMDAGVSESTVLKIGGWKTRAMLDRYNPLNEKRVRAAMVKSGEQVAARMNGTKS
jgi:integrase